MVLKSSVETDSFPERYHVGFNVKLRGFAIDPTGNMVNGRSLVLLMGRQHSFPDLVSGQFEMEEGGIEKPRDKAREALLAPIVRRAYLPLEEVVGLSVHPIQFSDRLSSQRVLELVEMVPLKEAIEEIRSGRVSFFLLANSYGIPIGAIGYNGTTVVLPWITGEVPYTTTGVLQEKFQEILDTLFSLRGDFKEKKPGAKINRDKILIGADIEYVPVGSDGVIHPAYEFVPDNQEAEVGTDGRVDTLEIRPEPSKTPEGLVANTADILRSLIEVLPDGVDLISGGGANQGVPIGLHIHFSGLKTDSEGPGRRVSPEYLCKWFDLLLAHPLRQKDGNARPRGGNYGLNSDFRNRNNHSFPHGGFEYRTLPCACGSYELTRAIFAIAYMAAVTFESGTDIEVDENNFSVNWYTGLMDYEKYSHDVEFFVKFINTTGSRLDVPVLATWFGKSFHKEPNGNVVCYFDQSQEHMGYQKVVGYNPKSPFRIILMSSRRGEGKWVVSDKKLSRVANTFLMAEYGCRVAVNADLKRTLQLGSDMTVSSGPDDTLTLALPDWLVDNLRNRSTGSRVRMRMFASSLIQKL